MHELSSLNLAAAKAGSANIHLMYAALRFDLDRLNVGLPNVIASSMRMAHIIAEVSSLFTNSTLCHD